jgi:hypothetical protein
MDRSSLPNNFIQQRKVVFYQNLAKEKALSEEGFNFCVSSISP